MIIEPGHVLHERWRIVRLIGEGGMGYVLEGYDEVLQRRIAIKALHPQLSVNASLHARFLSEARAMARLESPYVARILDAFSWEGIPVVVMEYIDGETLTDHLEKRPCPKEEETRTILHDTLRALHAAHAAGIVHRDVKPDNIMIVRTGDGVGARLLDFGVAQIEDAARHTRTGTAVGTVRYMSPEQVRDATRVDLRTDLYSLGVVAWQMLTGQTPWGAEPDDFSLRVAIVERPMPPLPPQVSATLRRFVEATLAKAPPERPLDADEALRLLAGQPNPALGGREAPVAQRGAQSGIDSGVAGGHRRGEGAGTVPEDTPSAAERQTIRVVNDSETPPKTPSGAQRRLEQSSASSIPASATVPPLDRTVIEPGLQGEASARDSRTPSVAMPTAVASTSGRVSAADRHGDLPAEATTAASRAPLPAAAQSTSLQGASPLRRRPKPAAILIGTTSLALVAVVLAVAIPSQRGPFPQSERPCETHASCGVGSCINNHCVLPPGSACEQPEHCWLGRCEGGVCVSEAWAHVEGGAFEMGSPEGEFGRLDDWEATRRSVTLTHDFLMLTAPVTQGDYLRFFPDAQPRFRHCGDRCPMESVSYLDATRLANQLSAYYGLPECYELSGRRRPEWSTPYACPGFRLPTEAEWEYAARAGSTLVTWMGPTSQMDDERPFAAMVDQRSGWTWLSDHVVYGNNEQTAYATGQRDSDGGAIACAAIRGREPDAADACGTVPVRSKPPNPWGLHDMLGNVAEWTSDGFHVPPTSGTDPFADANEAASRVVRGGGWNHTARFIRAAARRPESELLRDAAIGFRLVRTIPQP